MVAALHPSSLRRLAIAHGLEPLGARHDLQFAVERLGQCACWMKDLAQLADIALIEPVEISPGSGYDRLDVVVHRLLHHARAGTAHPPDATRMRGKTWVGTQGLSSRQ